MTTRESDDTIPFADPENDVIRVVADVWKILIIDDDHEVHRVTRLALKNLVYGQRRCEFISAYSRTEGEQKISEHPDVALILLDVVMEDDESGLHVIRFIRDQLQNRRVRIILRTGQPGHAPESEIIINYDINDYKEKTELTSQKLFTAVVSSLRSYQDISMIEANEVELTRLYNDLKQYSKGLETLVTERTRELSELNQDLEVTVKEKTRQLIKQEKSAIIGRLLQGMVHNLKTPLSVIRGYNFMIVQKFSSSVDSEINKFCDNIDEACGKMEVIMENLLVKSRMDQENAMTSVDINYLLNHEIQLLDANTQFKSEIHKEYHFADELPPVSLVYSDISQVFHNLINNAMDSMYNRENKTLIIATRQDNRCVYIDIEDSGSGIAADTI